MKVYIIGAGPGDPELITLKGKRLIESCPIILYTGSLVPKVHFEGLDSTTEILDSSGMTLEDIMAVLLRAKAENKDVARVHTGDPLIYGSTQEQMKRMDAEGITYEIIPGVSSFLAAAASIKQELTLPELTQTIILSRASGRTPVPDKENLQNLAKIEGTLCLFLSVNLMVKVVRDVTPYYGEDCPVAVVQKASMKEEIIVMGTLKDIVLKVKKAKITSQAMIIISKVIGKEDFKDSRLYAKEFSHGFRKAEVSP